MKPNGLNLRLKHGQPILQVTGPSMEEDMIWNAVESAVDAGWTPERFKREVASAWTEKLHREAEDAEKELLK